MNATNSGVAFSAAKIRSPSFSRSSSSMTTTALPAAMSAIARSTESSLVMPATLAVPPSEPSCDAPCYVALQYEPTGGGAYCPLPRSGRGAGPTFRSAAAKSRGGRSPLGGAPVGQQPLDVLGDDVDLEVDRGAHRGTT